MEPFRILDISGDIGITASGKTRGEAFLNAALGMYSLITDTDRIREETIIDIVVENQSPEGLLVSWLNELIFQFDAYGFTGKSIIIRDFTESSIRASVSGGYFDPALHEGKLLIKAATYHKLRIEKKKEGWEIDVIFDI